MTPVDAHPAKKEQHKRRGPDRQSSDLHVEYPSLLRRERLASFNGAREYEENGCPGRVAGYRIQDALLCWLRILQ